MIWVFFAVVALLLVGGIGALVTGRIGYDPLADPVHTRRETRLADDFTTGDVREVRLDTAWRGYRMDQVDDLLDQLEARLGAQEAQLSRFRGLTASPEADAGALAAPGDDADAGDAHADDAHADGAR